MSSLEDLKEKTLSTLQELHGRIEESELYQKVKERYDVLPPAMQKGVLATVVLIVTYIVLQLPMGYYSRASENLALYDENRNLVLDLYKVKRKQALAPPAAPILDSSALESRTRNIILGARVQAEQIKSIGFFDNAGANSSKSINKAISQNGIEARLSNLNLTQFVDIGHGLSNMGSNIKIVGISLAPGSASGSYFDVIFKIVNFTISDSSASFKDKAK